VASTLAYLVLFFLCRNLMDPQLANLLALLTTAVANTAANRRFTFGIAGGSDAARHHFEGLLVFGIGLALTSGALAFVHQSTTPDRWLELVTVTAANLAATAVKFLLFRLWVFRRRQPPEAAPVASAASATAADTTTTTTESEPRTSALSTEEAK
jgi:putative flippase GtrA